MFACGQTYSGIGVNKSSIQGRDFRFYISDVRLVDASGKETPVDLDQDGKWQLDDLALLDFENGTASCANGTPDMNREIKGHAPAGTYTGLRFTLGVPFAKNHTDPVTQPSPLNLTALSWVWNAGRKFARLDVAVVGRKQAFPIHLGSTGCTPSDTGITVPTKCVAPNRVTVELPSFQSDKDVVIADLGALLSGTDLAASEEPARMESGMTMSFGCMSGPKSASCAPLFNSLGLPFGDSTGGKQSFFRRGH
jgi:uncharacterized repeat protein (TIGR04052 family)